MIVLVPLHQHNLNHVCLQQLLTWKPVHNMCKNDA